MENQAQPEQQAQQPQPMITLKPVGSRFIRTSYPNLSVTSDRHMIMTTMEVVGHAQANDIFGNTIFVEELKAVEQKVTEATHYWKNCNVTVLYSTAEQRVPVALRIGAFELSFDKDSVRFEIEDNKIIVRSAYPAPAPAFQPTVGEQETSATAENAGEPELGETTQTIVDAVDAGKDASQEL